MKLWILERTDDKGCKYDCADGFVIRAPGPKTARLIASQNAGDEGRPLWLDKRRSSCKQIHVLGEPGVILRDFITG